MHTVLAMNVIVATVQEDLKNSSSTVMIVSYGSTPVWFSGTIKAVMRYSEVLVIQKGVTYSTTHPPRQTPAGVQPTTRP